MYKENISDDAVYDIMGKMLEKADKSLLKVDTRFAGTRNNPEYSGSISDIKTDNFTPENLTFGVLLGMTEELYNMFMQMKIKTNGVIGSGNGVRKNKAFVNIIEQKFGGDLKMPVHTEEAAVGSAMFGLVSYGIYKNAEEVQKLIRYEE